METWEALKTYVEFCRSHIDKNYTLRTCSPNEGHGSPYHVAEYSGRYSCYENDAFVPEYCAVTCYCSGSNGCNDFAAPPLSEEGNRKVQRSSCLIASSLTMLLSGLLLTVLLEK